MNKLLKALATPFRAVDNMLKKRRRTRKMRTSRVTPAQRDANRRDLDRHFRTVAASRRVAALPKRKHYGMGPKARAERRAIRKANRGYGSKKRKRRKGRKTRRGKRRTKSKK
tara:strand:- start:124 stop:459 length:336 start_codon:yes stop_codon:yes gene_type:complete